MTGPRRHTPASPEPSPPARAGRVPFYAYRARRYPWAEKLIQLAEAEHGEPVPVCRICGDQINLTRRSWRGSGLCEVCEQFS